MNEDYDIRTYCLHEWVNSYDFLGLVGNLYRHMYPVVCKKGCGSFKDSNGAIIEGYGPINE